MLGNLVFAKVNSDFSSYENGSVYLNSFIVDFEKENNLPSDFIFPLVNYDQDYLNKVILKKATSTWTYVVKKGESLWSISRKFNAPLKDLLVHNDLEENSILKAGEKIVIPGIEPQAVIGTASLKQFTGKFVSALKEVGDFLIPVSGFNWGKKHSQNGSDIAASCSTPVYAAHSGEVVEARDGWNGGYGNYIILRSKKGFYTLYGHLELRVVSVGEFVKQGQLIGYVGNTGYTLGPTGCHLHFEVRGKSNPLLK